MTPSSAASVLAAIEIMENEPERISHLMNLTRYARDRFKELGFDTGKSESPIIPLFIRDDIKALQMAQQLLEAGVFINPVVSPAVPKEDCIIRFSLMATHSYDQVDRAIEKIYSVAKKLDVLNCEVALNKEYL